MICAASVPVCPFVGWQRLEKFRVRLIFSCPSKRIFTHSCYRVSVFHHVCPAWCGSRLGNLFTTAASPSPEADDQKYQKISANEEPPAATCRMKTTLAALPAHFVLKTLTKGQLKHCLMGMFSEGCKASLAFPQLEPVVIPVRLSHLQDSQNSVLSIRRLPHVNPVASQRPVSVPSVNLLILTQGFRSVCEAKQRLRNPKRRSENAGK